VREAGSPVDPKQEAVNVLPSILGRDWCRTSEILIEHALTAFRAERPNDLSGDSLLAQPQLRVMKEVVRVGAQWLAP
jgi:hypothetical protein